MTLDHENEARSAGNLHESARIRHEPAQSDTQQSALDVLRNLDPGAKIAVRRLSPQYAGGYLGLLTVGEAGADNIEQELMDNWGGGTFRLQGRSLGGGEGSPDKPGFGRGCAVITIAGEPIKDGRRYVNGALESPHMSPALPLPQYLVQNTQQQPKNNLEGVLLSIVQQTLNRASSGDSAGIDFGGLGGLITALGSIMGPRNDTSDPMAMFERTLGMVGKMQKLAGVNENRGSEDHQDQGIFGAGSPLGNILMQKILGGSQSSVQPPATPIPANYWASHPQHNQPPPNYWPPPPGYVAPPPTQQPPPNWTRPPNSVISNQAQDAPPSPHVARDGRQHAQPEHAAAPTVQPDDQLVDEGPFTVDHLEMELADMSPDTRREFILEALSRLGIDQAIGSQIKAQMGAGAVGDASATFHVGNAFER